MIFSMFLLLLNSCTEISTNYSQLERTSDFKISDQPSEIKKSIENTPMKVEESGSLISSIYFFPVLDEDKVRCDGRQKKQLRNSNGNSLVQVCEKTWDACNLEGTCAVIQKELVHIYNVSDRIFGENRFDEVEKGGCKFGYGVKDFCLDPFYSVAADLRYYRAGDVIFVPATVGLILPDKSIHDGYFIIRDQGSNINGKGRFDFYSGFLSWRDPKNPFKKIGLDDKNTKLTYLKISGERADLIRKERSFPKVP